MSDPSDDSQKTDQMSMEDYESLLDQYQFNTKELSPGKLVKGKVIKVTRTHVLVDIGFKSEGVIPAEDFADIQDIRDLKPGDEVEAILEKSDMKDGYVHLSKRKAIAIKALNNLEKAYNHGSWIIGKVTEKIRNGYLVNVGISTFLPDSHADVRMVKDPAKLIGNRYKFKVIKFDRKSENAVLSRRLFLQDEKEQRKKQVFSQLVIGKKAKGQVKSLTNFGAFVDLGGIEGLLHISDMSWGKINHPSEIFKTGQEVEVVILDFNEKEEKISLGYRQLTADPWEDIDIKYASGQRIEGKVVSLTDFGAFVELEPGVEGLVHISDLTWSRKLIHPKKVLSLGEKVVVSILDINPEAKRISLGLKQVSPHPLEIFRQTYSPGARVKGTITSITDFGAFLEVEKGIEGLIHISDISWEKVSHPSSKLKVGDEIEAVVLNIDVEKQKLSLGIKQLEGDIWEDFFQRQRVGDMIKVKIVRIASFGVFVEIIPGIEGVVFLSELDERKIDDPSEAFQIGEERQAKIIKLNPRDKKISLSFRQAQADMQRMDYQRFMQTQNDRMTLGDLMKDKLAKIEAPKKSKSKTGPEEKTPSEETAESKPKPTAAAKAAEKESKPEKTKAPAKKKSAKKDTTTAKAEEGGEDAAKDTPPPDKSKAKKSKAAAKTTKTAAKTTKTAPKKKKAADETEPEPDASKEEQAQNKESQDIDNKEESDDQS